MEKKHKIFEKYLYTTILLLLIGGCIGTLLLVVSWMIPDSVLKEHCKGAMEIFKSEGISVAPDKRFFAYTYGSKLYADATYISEATADDENLSILQKAMNINGYSRYWHGYLVLLRPILAIFTYGQLRYLLSAFFIIMIYLVALELYKRLDNRISLALILSLIIVNFIDVPFCMDASITFMIAFPVMLCLLKKYNANESAIKSYILFLICGMLTSYVDLLTTPIITLGMPLLVSDGILWEV